MDYRKELDGIRALAVLLVLGFHFFPEIIRFGYLGVDIFFVLSGFLISSKILDSPKRSFYYYWSFILRRFKRLYPVILATICFTSILVVFLFTPDELKRFTRSAQASILGYANFFFWRDGGYFGGSDKLKPLLHFWSLAVEIQFYIFFPAVSFLILKFFNKWFFLFFSLSIIFISFALMIYLHKIGGSNPAFFLFPTRFWQFGIGFLGAYWMHIYEKTSERFNSIFPLILFIILSLPMIGYFSGPISNLIVSTSVLLIILSIGANSLIYKLFCSSVLTSIGKISFSVYCVHWPVVVFLNYYFIDQVSVSTLIMGILFCFLAGIFLYFVFERHYQKKISSIPLLLVTVALLVTVVFGLPNLSRSELSLSTRLAAAAGTHYRCPVSTLIPYGASRACKIGKDEFPTNTAIVGNSHAQMYAPLISRRLAEKGENALLVPLNGCLPTFTYNITAECANLAEINFKTLLNDQELTNIILASTWEDKLFFKSETGNFDGNLDEVVLALMNMIETYQRAGKVVTLIGPIVTPGYDYPSLVSRKIRFQSLSKEEYNKLRGTQATSLRTRYDKYSDVFSDYLGENYIAPMQKLCDQHRCYFSDSAGSYFADSSHLSNYGRSILQDIFEKIK